MRITLDRMRCTGHGRCYTVAPEVFVAGCHIRRAEDAISLEE